MNHQAFDRLIAFGLRKCFPGFIQTFLAIVRCYCSSGEHQVSALNFLFSELISFEFCGRIFPSYFLLYFFTYYYLRRYGSSAGKNPEPLAGKLPSTPRLIDLSTTNQSIYILPHGFDTLNLNLCSIV